MFQFPPSPPSILWETKEEMERVPNFFGYQQKKTDHVKEKGFFWLDIAGGEFSIMRRSLVLHQFMRRVFGLRKKGLLYETSLKGEAEKVY